MDLLHALWYGTRAVGFYCTCSEFTARAVKFTARAVLWNRPLQSAVRTNVRCPRPQSAKKISHTHHHACASRPKTVGPAGRAGLSAGRRRPAISSGGGPARPGRLTGRPRTAGKESGRPRPAGRQAAFLLYYKFRCFPASQVKLLCLNIKI